MIDKAYKLLGLAKKAGKAVSGSFQTEQAVRTGQAKLVVIAADASAGSRKFFEDKASWRKIPAVVWGTKEELGHALGQGERSSLALLDEGFAQAFLKAAVGPRPAMKDEEGE